MDKRTPPAEGARELMKKKTVVFEDKYGVDINNLNSTIEIDMVIEKAIGRKLDIKKTDIFPIKKYDVNKMLDEALERL